MSALIVHNAIVNALRGNASMDAEFSIALSGTVTSSGTTVTGNNTQFTTALKNKNYIGDITHGYRQISNIVNDTQLTIDSAFNTNFSNEAIKQTLIEKGLAKTLNMTEIGRALRVIFSVSSDLEGHIVSNRIMAGYGFLVAIAFFELDTIKADERKIFYDKLIRDAVDNGPTFGQSCEGNTEMGTFNVEESFDTDGLYAGIMPLLCYRRENRGNR